MSRGTLLDWFPFDPVAMQRIVGRVSIEEYGALLLVCGEAWRDPIPCTIENTSAALDRLLGSRWRKLADVVRRHFTPCVEHEGRLRCAWLWDLYQVQLVKYQNKARGGHAGGTAPTAEGKRRGRPPRSRNAQPGAVSNSSEGSTDNSSGNSTAISDAIAERKRGLSPGPDGPGGESPPAATAAGADAARAGSAPLAPTAAAEDGDAAQGAPRRDWRTPTAWLGGISDSVTAAVAAAASRDRAEAEQRLGADGDAPAPTQPELALRWLAEQPDCAERQAAIRRRAEALVGQDAAEWRLHAAIEAETVGEYLAQLHSEQAEERAAQRLAERRRRRGLDVEPAPVPQEEMREEREPTGAAA